jgi:hypothetical protein
MAPSPTFSAMADAGFGDDVLPIIPPGAPVSVHAREGISSGRGKIPGKVHRDGWAGFPKWNHHTVTADDRRRWDNSRASKDPANHAGIGLRGNNFPAVDIDVDDPDLSDRLRTIVLEIAGAAPCRRTRHLDTGEPGARCLLLYRGRIGHRPDIVFKVGEREHRIELKAAGKQCVMFGLHGKKGEPDGTQYDWDDGRSPIEVTAQGLTLLTEETATTLWEALAKIVESAGGVLTSRQGGGARSSGAGGSPPPQDSLREPNAGAVARVLADLPNDLPTRAEWLALSCAIKAAAGEAVFEAWETWSLKWEENDPEGVRDLWDSLKPPFRTGWSQFSSWATSAGGNPAGEEFDVVETETAGAEPARPRKQLTTFNAASLQNRTFEPVRWVVPGFIPDGLSMLAGKPKLGKSWLMLDTAHAVASGGEVLGARCGQGSVLYAALEDTERRLQSRMTKMCPNQAWPDELEFALEMPMLEAGGLEYLRDWIRRAKDPRLIIIDVFTKVRRQKGNQENLYDSDYKAVVPLKQLADETGVAIVVVHHLRKAPSDADPFDTVSGSTGLTGAMDTILVMNRGPAGVSLYVRGRDVDETDTAISFDKGTCRWANEGDAATVRISEERRLILDALRDAGAPLGPTELTNVTEHPYGAVRKLLFLMIRSGEIVKSGRGKYTLPDITPQNIGNKVTNGRGALPFDTDDCSIVPDVTDVVGTPLPEVRYDA